MHDPWQREVIVGADMLPTALRLTAWLAVGTLQWTLASAWERSPHKLTIAPQKDNLSKLFYFDVPSTVLNWFMCPSRPKVKNGRNFGYKEATCAHKKMHERKKMPRMFSFQLKFVMLHNPTVMSCVTSFELVTWE